MKPLWKLCNNSIYTCTCAFACACARERGSGGRRGVVSGGSVGRVVLVFVSVMLCVLILQDC